MSAHLPRALPLLALISLTLILVPALSEGHTHQCKHDNITLPKLRVPVPHEKESDGRLLSTYSSIRVVFDTSSLSGSDTVTYIETYLLPAAKNYIEATLKVIPVSGALSFAKSDVEECGMSLASQYYDTGAGVDADLVISVTASSETDEEYVAYAGACLLDDTTNRPILGLLNFNLAYVAATTNNITIQDNLAVTIHEMTHVLGFSSGLFEYYIDPSTNAVLSNVTTNLTVNGWTQTAVITSTVKSFVQDYFDCSTAVGAYLENQGGDMSSNSHWERRIFNNEYMTASAINDLRFSKLTLSLLQDSGWYEVDFSMADNITYGAGEGCNFLNTKCVDTTTKLVNFDEFCTLGAMGCNWAGTGKSYCSYSTASSSLYSYENYWGNNTETWDEFADNCPTFAVYSNGDCGDATLQDDAILPDDESFEYGAKCFMGTLYTYPQSLTQKYPYCFKPTCVRANDGSYVVEVKIGSTTVNCTASGQVSVSGYGGYLVCPDPDTFCTTVMAEDNCRGNCMGRGTCVSNTTCECDDGWTYIDCSRKEYIDNYASCTSDTWQTTLYGDDCVCNPSNITCACNNGINSAETCCDAGLSSYCSNKTKVIIGAVVGSVGGVIVIAVIIIVYKKMAAAKAAKLAARAAGSHQPVALNSPGANPASYPPTMQSPQAYAPQAGPNMGMQAGYNQAPMMQGQPQYPIMQGQPQYPVMQGQAPQSVNVRPANYQY